MEKKKYLADYIFYNRLFTIKTVAMSTSLHLHKLHFYRRRYILLYTFWPVPDELVDIQSVGSHVCLLLPAIPWLRKVKEAGGKIRQKSGCIKTAAAVWVF